MSDQGERLVVGLTGGIGSGKSLVSDTFAGFSIVVVDTDVIAHELTGPNGAAIEAIRAAFGDDAISAQSSLDRNWMRNRVFNDPAERTRLEAILHPKIGQISRERVAAAESPYTILAVPLLIESGNWKKRVDRVVVVDCPVEIQIERVMKRSKLAREQVQAIINVQASREQRLAAADDVIDNSGSIAHAVEQTRALHEKYLDLAKQR